jgi:hypothetical protein
MNKNEKTDVCYNIGFNTELNEQTNKNTMNNNNRIQEKKQFVFNIGSRPPKVIICFHCKRETEHDGFVFKLVEVCRDCRTSSELKNLANKIERREK